MTHNPSPIAVMPLPETFNAERVRMFLSDLESCMDDSSPRIVLDCSNLRELCKPTIHLLLCCLEEAMKRNGGIRLAAIPPGVSMIFDFSELDGLFEVFDTTARAVKSFQRPYLDRIVQKDDLGSCPNITANRA